MSEDEREEGKLPGVFKAPDCAQLNELLPAFRFEELIACGGMGAVYRARQLSLGRDVAIKVLPPEISAAGSVFVESFKVEARTMASLNHPNLVGIHDFGEVSGMLYLVMEYIDGNALYRSIRGRKVKQEQAVEIVEEVARGLGEAHGRGLLHRDIKPANILLTSKRKPVLGDFGLVVRSDAVGSGLNMGTPGYTAPEVVRDFEAASTSSDVYALGMILHEMLSGVMPTGEQAPDLSLVPDMNGLRRLVGRVVSSDPSQRPADGEALAEELASWLEGARRTRGLLLTPGTSGVRPSQPVARSPGAGSSPLKPVGAVEGARRTQGLLLTPEPPGTRPAQPTVLSPGVGSAPMQPAGAGRPASKGWWGLGLGALVVVLLALVGIAMVQREREPRHGGPDKVATAGEGGTAENEKGRRSPGPPGEVDQAETGGPIRDLVVRRYGKNFQSLAELRAAGGEEHPGEKVGDGLLNLVHGGKEACGLVWEGSLRVPETGLYQFTLRASSGAALVIYEEEQVVSGSGSPVSAHVLLRRGHAPLRVEYFQREGESGPVLSLHWSGPGLDGNFSLVRRSASRGGAIARNDPAPGPVEPEPAPEPKPKKPEKISQDLIAYWSFDQRKPRAGSRFTRTDLGVKEKLIRKGDPLRYHRPAADPGSRKWSSPGFDDSADWLDGRNGIGYEDEPGDFKDLLETTIETEKGKHPHSLYLRIPFEVKDPKAYKRLALFIRYDDGFRASLNGSALGESENAPFPFLWNSGSTKKRNDRDAVVAEQIAVSRGLKELVPGTNILAIHALNDGEKSKPNATNTGCASTDMLIVAELVGLRKDGELPEEELVKLHKLEREIKPDMIGEGTEVTEGRFGEAYDFQAGSLDIGGDKNEVAIADRSYTVSLWFTSKPPDSRVRGLISAGGGPKEMAGWALWIEGNGSGLTFRVGDGNVASDLTAKKDSLMDGEWHHVAVTVERESRKVCLFLDGELVAEKRKVEALAVKTIGSPSGLCIGRNSDDQQHHLGKIDDVALWHRALLPEEIEKIFQSGEAAGDLFEAEPGVDKPAARKKAEATFNEAELRKCKVEDKTLILIRGVSYKYYEGSWDALPDFDTIKAVKTGTADDFSLRMADTRPDGYALAFTGYLEVREPGLYTFQTTSDDGSALRVDGELVVDNNGIHPSVTKSGELQLRKGWRKIEVLFFEDKLEQALSVRYKGPDTPLQALPCWREKPPGPLRDFTQKNSGKTLKARTVFVSGNEVHLVPEDKKEVSILVDSLSEEDQQYLKDWVADRER